MKPFKCPKCQVEAITAKQKYKAGFWKDIYCGHCGARLCGHPWLMALIYVAYLWAVAWFLAWPYFAGNWWLALGLIPTWLLLDYLNVRFMPLVILRPKPSGPAPGSPGLNNPNE